MYRLRNLKKDGKQGFKTTQYNKGLESGINLALKITYEVMNEEFGFGNKRLDRLEDGIFKKLKELEE